MNFRVLLRLIGAACLWAISGLCIAQAGANNGIPVASTTGELKPALAGTASISDRCACPGEHCERASRFPSHGKSMANSRKHSETHRLTAATASPASLRPAIGSVQAASIPERCCNVSTTSTMLRPAVSLLSLLSPSAKASSAAASTSTSATAARSRGSSSMRIRRVRSPATRHP